MKEMGLTGKITPDQVAKKWDNLKTKFKVKIFKSFCTELQFAQHEHDEPAVKENLIRGETRQ